MKLVIPFLLLALAPAPALAQSAASRPVRQDAASVLGRGWTALGAQQPAQALALAQQLLRATPASHDALALALAALIAAGQPTQALDAYETWIAASRHEDLFLLQPVATGLLRQLGQSREPHIKLAALSALSQAGDAAARQQMDAMLGEQGAPAGVDADLASAGDQAAVGRLEAQISGGGRGDKSAAIDALARANAKGSVQALIGALKDPVPPSRMAAANALAELEAVAALPALKAALGDPDPAVRHMVAVAMARLGDESGGVTMASLAASPVGELRLIAARNAARTDPQGAWAETAQGLLRDPDPLLRLKAARLLLGSERPSAAASALLTTALGDETPAVRTEAARLLRELAQEHPAGLDPGALRRLLRDRLPEVRVEAARTLLAALR